MPTTRRESSPGRSSRRSPRSASRQSPLLYQNLVIVQRDDDNGDNSLIVAYDKKTGKEAWKTKRSIDINWGTPVLVEAGGRT